MPRNYKQEYANYQGTEKQKKHRAERNKARRTMIREGKARKGDGKDVGHIKKNNNGLKNQQKLMQQAWEYEKEGMGLQYNYGQQAADAEYKRKVS